MYVHKVPRMEQGSFVMDVFANSKDIFTSHFFMAFALAFALDVFEVHDDGAVSCSKGYCIANHSSTKLVKIQNRLQSLKLK